MTRLIFSIHFVAAVLGGGLLVAQESVAQENGVTADDVIDGYIEAVGGEMTLLGIESATIEGTLSGSADTGGGGRMDMSGTLKFQAKSGMMIIESKVGMAGSEGAGSIQGYDGSTWWRNSGGERQELDEQSVLGMVAFVFCSNQALHWRDHFSRIENPVEEEFEGKDAWHLVFMFADNPVNHYFDKSSGLLIGTRSSMNGQDMTVTYEYREVEGLVCISKIIMKANEPVQLDYLVELENFDFETEIPDERFKGEIESKPEDDQ